ncbi:MAG: hypothetical protein V1494_05105 [Candidatus Diapherotrites archaeon]
MFGAIILIGGAIEESLALERNQYGRALTDFLHSRTLNELENTAFLDGEIERVFAEKKVLLEPEKFSQREGRFDFLAETKNGKLIGFEVLTRPSKHKLEKKLAYSKSVDEFVFVLPSEAMGFYRKPKQRVFNRCCRQKFFGKSFADKKLKAWIYSLGEKRFTEKAAFSEVFNVKR